MISFIGYPFRPVEMIDSMIYEFFEKVRFWHNLPYIV